MTQPSHQPRASLSLFPSANISNPQPPAIRNQTPLGRRSESRERRTPTPQHQPQQPLQGLGLRAASPQASPPRNGRQTPQDTARPVAAEFAQPAQHAQAHPLQQNRPQWPLQQQPEVVIQLPTPVADVPRLGESAFGVHEAQSRATPAQEAPYRSSIAKAPLSDDPSGQSPSEQPLRSMFPTYNPHVALEHQQYMPTQTSPTHIPRAVISRQGNYVPDDDAGEDGQTVRSPARAAEPARTWQRIAQQPPVIPQVCTAEQLKSLWRVANGWRASSSEGRIYCLKLSQEKDAPVYTLASQTQPFWNLRIDPTSVSARVTLTRHDPSKPFRSPKPDSPSSGIFRGSGAGSIARKAEAAKDWQEALSTTLEEEARRHQPNDGLTALLMPTPASKMAEERGDAPTALQMAENECGKLVYDDDTDTYFLVHAAIQKPFFVNIERSPAWSRTEYTLEHTESPQHLAKLTRDGSGGGWLELDTGLASKIDSFFILDVAVATLLLVASFDEKNSPTVAVESFEAPPPPVQTVTAKGKKHGGAKKEAKDRRKMEDFDIDIESQDDSLSKAATSKVKEKKTEDKLPFLIRVIVKLTKGVFKVFIFFLTMIAKCFGLVFKCFYKCLGSKY